MSYLDQLDSVRRIGARLALSGGYLNREDLPEDLQNISY